MAMTTATATARSAQKNVGVMELVPSPKPPRKLTPNPCLPRGRSERATYVKKCKTEGKDLVSLFSRTSLFRVQVRPLRRWLLDQTDDDVPGQSGHCGHSPARTPEGDGLGPHRRTYNTLAQRRTPSPVVELKLAVANAMALGRRRTLEFVDGLATGSGAQAQLPNPGVAV